MITIDVDVGEVSRCPLCGSDDVLRSTCLPSLVLTSDFLVRYHFQEETVPQLLTCTNCSLAYKNFEIDHDGEREIYELWRSSHGVRWAHPSNLSVNPTDLIADIKSKFEATNGRPPQTIIDIGAGEGGYLDGFTGIERSSLDISEQSARENSSRGIKGIVADICSERFIVSQQFDVVTCFDVLEHLSAPDVALRNISSLLRPGGLFIAETGNILSPLPALNGAQNWWYVNIPEHKVFWHEELLRVSLSKWKLQITDVQMRSHKGRSVWSPKNVIKLFLSLTNLNARARPFRKVFMIDHIHFTSTKIS